MAHNQSMVAKNKAKWADKVRIVGLSIDWNVPEAVEKHVNKKGWTEPALNTTWRPIRSS